jgi:acyl-CoA thioesterase
VAEAQAAPAEPGPFERDTAVSLSERDGESARFAASVGDGWRAGRGPHGGYLAAMLLRALIETVAEEQRAPRSLTIHYARAPEPGPVEISTRIERAGRSLSTLSARMEQDGRLMALVLAAFSVPWHTAEIDHLPMPDVEGPDVERRPGTGLQFGAPPFSEHLVLQPRFQGRPLTGERRPMELGAWVGLAEARPTDALSVAFFTDALIPTPFMATGEPTAAPTIDLTIHFRQALPRPQDRAPNQLCYAQMASKLLHEGFFEEDGVVWAPDGTVLAQSRQLALLMPVG